MGMFQVRVKVANPSSPDIFFEEDFRVDTGALYSFVPEDRLEPIRIVPFGKRNLVLADGRTDQRPIGSALFQIQGFSERVPCPVIFAPRGSLCLIGATALENFGLDVDPTAKKLKPIPPSSAGSLPLNSRDKRRSICVQTSSTV